MRNAITLAIVAVTAACPNVDVVGEGTGGPVPFSERAGDEGDEGEGDEGEGDEGEGDDGEGDKSAA